MLAEEARTLKGWASAVPTTIPGHHKSIAHTVLALHTICPAESKMLLVPEPGA